MVLQAAATPAREEHPAPAIDWLATGGCFTFPAVGRAGIRNIIWGSRRGDHVVKSLMWVCSSDAESDSAMDAPPSQIGGMLFGYDIGVSSGALVSLTTAASSTTDWGTGLDPLTVGLVVSSSLMGALAGSVGVLLQGDRLGRRTELLAAAGLYGGCSKPRGTMAGASGCGTVWQVHLDRPAYMNLPRNHTGALAFVR